MTDEHTTPDQPAAAETPSDAPAENSAENSAETPAETPADQAPARTRLRDRAFGVRSVAAVALATLILGGVGGAAIGVVASGDDHDGQRHGPSDIRMPEGDHGRPPGGGMPPGTTPDDEVQPDSGDSSSSSDSGTNS